jgi:GDP-L-fucose synthase
MKIFMTGGHGFLGKALAASLSKAGHAVTAPRRAEADLTEQDSLEKFKDKYDRVYHVAAWTQAGDFSLTHSGEQWLINQKLNTNVLSWWRRLQPQAKFISIGTSCAYPPGANLQEKDYMNGEPIESLYTYAMTKRMLYTGQLALRKQYGLTHLTVVPSTLYGPDYHQDGRQMHFIFDLIRKIIRAKELGETAVLWGDGHQRREVVFREDFIALMEILADSRENDLINIGAGEDHSIRDFAEMICRVVGYPASKIRYDETRYVGAGQKSLDIGKLRGLVPTFRFTPLSEGLQKTVAWFYAVKAYEDKTSA